jgi:uncharacterized protein (TIGR03437 family)
LFSADASGKGLAAAVALRVKSNGEQLYEPIARYDTTLNRFVALPIDLSNPAEQVYLILFGTGFRHRSALTNVKARIGNLDAEVLFAGAQEGLVGLDQCNVRLPNSLAGQGELDVVLTVDGLATNTVKVRVK